MGYPVSIYYYYLCGAIMMGCFVVGAFFLRAWKRTGERILGVFGFAFWIMAFERVVLVLLNDPNREDYAAVYLIRLMAFVMILLGILDANRKEKGSG